MADSIPSLRRKLLEAEIQIKELQDQLSQSKAVALSPVIYVDNPDHIEMIKMLQEKICQFNSQ